jgi:hypothetical protein
MCVLSSAGRGKPCVALVTLNATALVYVDSAYSQIPRRRANGQSDDSTQGQRCILIPEHFVKIMQKP